MDQSVVDVLIVVQIVVSAFMVVSILLQNRAEGLGQLFGGGGETFRTKRGLEKFLYYATLVLAAVFVVLSLLIVKFTR